MHDDPNTLNYALPPEHPAPRPPLVSVGFLVLGAIVSLNNLALIIWEGGESFMSPALSTLSLLIFAAGAVISGVYWLHRRHRASLLTLLHLLGIVASIVLGCAGLPSR